MGKRGEEEEEEKLVRKERVEGEEKKGERAWERQRMRNIFQSPGRKNWEEEGKKRR